VVPVTGCDFGVLEVRRLQRLKIIVVEFAQGDILVFVLMIDVCSSALLVCSLNYVMGLQYIQLPLLHDNACL
jgi:hypothetical protein